MADGEVENRPSQSFRVLLPDDDVLRALLKKAWLDALHEAFFLKSDEDELSVCYDCHADQCLDVLGINTVYGAAQLKVELVATLGLTVVTDSEHHAAILGLPHKEVDPMRAERLASGLA